MLRPLLACLLTAALVAADPPERATQPTPMEWATTQKALKAEPINGQAKLLELIKAYPAWADGPLALANHHLVAGRPNEAVEPARRASRLGNPQADAVLARALLGSSRPREALAAVTASKAVDADGWLHYWGAAAAAAMGDSAKARALLADARARAGAKIPKDFAFLAGRLAGQNRDWVAAESAFAEAVSRDLDFWDAWYELGRVRALRAELEPSGAEQLWGGAVNAFAAAVKGRPQDLAARTGLARAKSGLARCAHAAGDQASETSRLREALIQLDIVLLAKPDDRDAHLLAGDAHLHLAEWPAAAEHLARARTLGAKDRALPFNLALALHNAGRSSEATAVLGSLSAVSAGERITVGLNAYTNGQYQLAAKLLAEAGADPVLDAETAGAALRFAGHAYANLAERGGGAEALNSASACYRSAGDLRDVPGRRFHLALEGAIDAPRAYAAAWTWLAWEGYRSLPAWFQVVGHYGAATSHGQGLGGVARHAPVHLVFWAVLVTLPLGMFALALLRHLREPVDEIPQPAPRPVAARPPAPRRAASKDETEDYFTPPRRKAPPTPTPTKRPASGEKDETRVASVLPPKVTARRADEKAGTADMDPGQADPTATMKPTAFVHGAGALEPKRRP